MQLSSRVLAFVLLLVPFTFAQHHNSAGSSSPPGPAPAPSPAPAMHSSPPPSAPSMPSAPSHTFTPSVSPSTNAPVHSAPTLPHSTPVHESAPPTSRSNQTINPVGEKGALGSPQAKAPDPVKSTSDLRVNKNPEQAPVSAPPVQSDLRKRMCHAGLPCEESTPQPPQKDSLRHCMVGADCGCPPGQTNSKGGCVATPVSKSQQSCDPGTSWNGSSCVQTSDCPAGQSWNGAQCASIVCPAGQIRRGASCVADCTGATGFTAGKIAEVRSARQVKDDACRQSPSSTACQQAELHYFTVLNEYRGLLSSVPIECQTTLPMPETL